MWRSARPRFTPPCRCGDRDARGAMAGESTPVLAEMAAGGRCVLVRLVGGQAFVCRMAALGFTPGTELSVLRNARHGALIVRVRDSRVALGRVEARQIAVRPAPEDE